MEIARQVQIVPESAALTSFPSGTILSINPVLEFETELTEGVSATANYSNDDPTHFWKGNEQVSVSLTNNGNTVILSFKLTNGDEVELIVSNFIDIGNDGYVDEYSVIGKVNGEVKIDQIGRFTGAVKPRFPNSPSDINVNRAPTKEEFDMFVSGAGSLFLFQSESSPDAEDEGVVELKAMEQLSATMLMGIGHKNGSPLHTFTITMMAVRFFTHPLLDI